MQKKLNLQSHVNARCQIYLWFLNFSFFTCHLFLCLRWVFFIFSYLPFPISMIFFEKISQGLVKAPRVWCKISEEYKNNSNIWIIQLPNILAWKKLPPWSNYIVHFYVFNLFTASIPFISLFCRLSLFSW